MTTPDIPGARAELASARTALEIAAGQLEDAAAAVAAAQAETTTALADVIGAMAKLEGPVDPTPTEHYTVDAAGIIRTPAGAIFRPDGANVTGADSYQWGQEWDPHGKAATWRARGATAVRHVMYRHLWPNHVATQHYGELDDLITEYTGAGIVVILDNHEGALGGGRSPAEVEYATDLFRDLALRYGANPLVWYEPFNEPMDEGQTLDLATWLGYHRPVCAAIREHTQAPIVVCASMFGQDRPGFGGFDPSSSSLLNGVPVLADEFGTVVGDLHGYHRWGGATTAADHRAYWLEARSRGVAILVGEFGAWSLHGQFDDEERQASRLLWDGAPHYVGLLPWMTGTWGDDFWTEQAERMLVPVADVVPGGGTEPPPPGDYPVPTISLVAGAGTLGVAITHPAELPAQYDYMVVAWGGPSGFIGARTHQRPFPSSDAITGLTNGTTYTVQVGYGDAPANVPEDKLATATGTPVGGGNGGGGTAYPRGGTITDRGNWIMARAGLADPSRLRVVGPGNVPQGCQWVADAGGWPSLYVWEATLLEDLDIPARIVPRAVPGNPAITLRNVRFYDSFTWEGGQGANRIKVVERCHSTGPGASVVSSRTWGQANLNALAAGWVARGTILEGMADNVQQSGGGLLEECVLRNLVIYGPAGSGSHNDHIQNYGGLVQLRRTLVEQTVTAAQDSHVNSVFCDGGDYDLEDCLVLITAPAGSNTWALHAAKGSNRIVVRHTSVRGKTVGNIVQQEGADISSPY